MSNETPRSIALEQLGQMSAADKRALVKRQRATDVAHQADAIAARLGAWRCVLLFAARNQVTQDLAEAAVETASPGSPAPAPAQAELCEVDDLDALLNGP